MVQKKPPAKDTDKNHEVNTNAKVTKASAGDAKSKSSRPRAPRAPAPVNVDKQCGVELPNGGLCGRSLTCKTHSMGAKRAVTGRSQAFDTLLVAHNQQKQAKLALKVALSGSNSGNSGKNGRQNNKASGSGSGAASKEGTHDDGSHTNNGSDFSDGADDEPLTEQEEVQHVLRGVMKSQPLPLSRRTIIGTRPRTQYLRSRELLFQALSRIPALGDDGGAAAAASGLLGSAMAVTGALLGRAVLYETTSGAQVARMSRVQARRIVYAQAQAKAQANARAKTASVIAANGSQSDAAASSSVANNASAAKQG